MAPAVLQYSSTGKTEILGRLVSPEEILPELLEDQDFYTESGGGVTLSGGTPVFWPGKFHGLYSPWGRKELK